MATLSFSEMSMLPPLPYSVGRVVQVNPDRAIAEDAGL